MDLGLCISVSLMFFSTLLFLIVRKNTSGPKQSLPPGPRPLPLLGNLLHLKGETLVNAFLKLADKYGQVFTLHLGPRRVVVICGYNHVKKALVDQAEDFAAKPDFAITDRTSKGYGIAFTNGNRWKQLRRFSLMTLRNFGMGKCSIEERIQEEISFLVEEIKKTKEMPFNPGFFLKRSVSNIICSIMFGKRYEYNDEEFHKLLDLLNENLRLVDSFWVQMYSLFPSVVKYLWGSHNLLFENYKKQKQFVAKIVEDHEKSFDPSSPRDYIDAFLIKILEDKGNLNSEFHHENLVVTALDIFFAGTETTSVTLQYGLLLLLKFPHVEKKINEEILQVIGPNRSPCMEHRSQMPYTEAVIHEIQRFIDIVPIGIPRATTRDTKFNEYNIPKDTFIFPVLNSVHFDPTQYKDPENFNPNHFLDENEHFKRNDAFMPFSAGKRICIGEGLARMELFLFLTTILQNFSIKAPTDVKEIDISPEYSGFGKMPPYYEFCLLPRST
ncbi:cytochrome P450 2B11-like [Erpetoichthys calabaricus]|uniref:Cytochrome P450 2B11-like n=1 Tax=Erpetoichthys calabaricus TaxID=27687 RepID=A0A8C4TEV6_ERPCA|nr:cytochrome P450 2B11-like [Erpetoichthys calabaricus]